MPAQLGHARLKGVSGAQRLIVENHKQCLAAQDIIVMNAFDPIAFQVGCHIKDGFYLFAGEICFSEKISSSKSFGFHASVLLFAAIFVLHPCKYLSDQWL